LLYVATMVSSTPENERRIAKHRRSRAGAGFTTVVSPTADLLGYPGWSPANTTVLLEDVSNLLANLAFGEHIPDPAAATLRRIAELRAGLRHLVAVSIGGLAPDSTHDVETRDYITALNAVNETLSQQADQVIHR
jgi:adenosylcobinamide kinase/adenosylcobinamide-phosphate guanylyltransferase